MRRPECRGRIGDRSKAAIMLPPIPWSETKMPHAIIRGKNGRRHEVDFDDEAVSVEIHSSEETVEIFIEADFETLPEGRRRFTSESGRWLSMIIQT
jgi:hypothetical protein